MTPEELEQIAESERESAELLHAHRARLRGCWMPLVPERIGEDRRCEKEVAARQSGTDARSKASAAWACARKGRWSRPDGGVLYQKVTPRRMRAAILDSARGRSCRATRLPDRCSILRATNKIVLENSGNIDPERIEDYIAATATRP